MKLQELIDEAILEAQKQGYSEQQARQMEIVIDVGQKPEPGDDHGVKSAVLIEQDDDEHYEPQIYLSLDTVNASRRSFSPFHDEPDSDD